jgi:damage-control phosphatase, subfamily I
MRTSLHCVPCFVRQVAEASRLATQDTTLHEQILREALRRIAAMDLGQPPPRVSGDIYRLIREATGDPDPFREAKAGSNALALRLYPRLAEEVRQADDPFERAIRLAIAGNVIDFGLGKGVTEEQVLEAIEQAADQPLDRDAVGALREAASRAATILYVADNAGEIVLDRLLIERLPLDRVTVVVRGGPIINDATMADAEVAGLTSLVRVIDNGHDAPGTVLELCSDEFREHFDYADLVISKGQGNYETLSETDREVFFLLKAKCDVIARDIGCDVGHIVVRHGKPAEP